MALTKITCPYCFAVFQDDKVHFRSEKANNGECPEITDDYDDFEDFMLNFKGSAAEKEEIRKRVEEWNFFKTDTDESYDRFWKKHGGTTTEHVSPRRASYRHKVIEPENGYHQKFLRKQEDGGYLRYTDGFATSIVLNDGTICTQRVCPECHNPLPSQYGKNEARFIALIGVTGSGKTVYLSRLIYGFDNYVAKAGLASLPLDAAAHEFLKNYPVKTNVVLPGSTPPAQFLQPLFYNLVKLDESGKQKIYTLVIYDVAGENCDREGMYQWFGEFIGHMEGIFLLIDPMQFGVIKSIDDKEDSGVGNPTSVLQAIHDYITGGKSGMCDTPLAVCISKSDMEQVQDVLEDNLVSALMEDVEEVTDANGQLLTRFNSKDYNPIAVELQKFIKREERSLELLISRNYSCYNYFAFSSFDCDVRDNIPQGPIRSKRIEEPLLWLFHKFGFIGADPAVVEYGAPCPCCGTTLYRRKLSGNERLVEEVVKKGGFLGIGKKTEIREYDYYCEACDQYYNS